MILIEINRVCDFKPYFYYALEEYALEHLLKKNPSETFFFTWEIKGVVVGKNQVIENEVNLEYLKKNNIDLFRRPTGGGCVYNDLETPLFSIITKKESNFSFKNFLSQIVIALRKLNLNVEFSGRNDLLLEGKKISGNSFRQNKNGMVGHGTLLYECDIETMVNVITPNIPKLISKGIDSVRSRVTNLKKYLPNKMTKKELIKYLINALTQKKYVLSEREIQMLEKESLKYNSPQFLFLEQPSHTKILKKRFLWGNIEVFLDIKFGKIESMSLRGDFFFKEDNLEEFTQKFTKVIYQSQNLKEILAQNDIGFYILDATNQDFLSLLKEGILEEQLKIK